MQHTLTILLQNETGALARVAGLFASRSYNIDSLNVAATADPTISRLVLSIRGDDNAVVQIVRQTRKLIDVLEVRHLAEDARP
ncbi:MAG: acetolactate synthase small subunit [Rhodanobacter sp.]